MGGITGLFLEYYNSHLTHDKTYLIASMSGFFLWRCGHWLRRVFVFFNIKFFCPPSSGIYFCVRTITLHQKGICIWSYHMSWSSATNIWNKYTIYFESKYHLIHAGIEPRTFWSLVAHSAIWATVLWLNIHIFSKKNYKLLFFQFSCSGLLKKQLLNALQFKSNVYASHQVLHR